MIKSIKHSFYKTIGNRILTVEDLMTLMIEVEGSLNSRPLTYQGSLYEEIKPLRAIDFLVREIKITYPFENLRDDKKDPSYLPPAELAHLQTQRQAEEALLSSHKFTEQYWKIWHKMYLSSLRESHKLQMDKKRSGTKFPIVGTVVLLADPNTPRNTWRMGRITELKESADAVIREATVRMPNGSCLRRPINLLIPLEFEDQSEAQSVGKEDKIDHSPSEQAAEEPQRHKFTEQYWKIWHKMYLSSLRESHKLQMDKKRSGTKFPMVGTVVLLADPNTPRNTWRMGRITELKESADAVIREATVRMPNGSCLRRPINLLIPLEFEDQSEAQSVGKEDKIDHSPSEQAAEEPQRYNLRKRRRINYNEEGREPTTSTVNRMHRRIFPHTTMIALTIICLSLPPRLPKEAIL
ncbi:unnamed protein product [Heligmosomoides polygyrus]|uniref:DUF5641 domain-containing protein n=1 Tax=Heligmosomoides polygyrus TaxID=6339 RepID=A0A3P8G3S5_HELPZ|nr:unnamed protein product [Heligmosomoides polygyrus]